MRPRRWWPLFSAIILIVSAFLYMCHVSWHRWASVVVDGGREMNLPLRLLKGEMIYSQAYYLYGPFAPYLNAFLYKIFGIHLNTLYAAGIVCSVLILVMVFQISRSIMSLLSATLATLTVLIFEFKPQGHSIFPYTFSALYGTTLALAAFAAQFCYVRKQKTIYLIVSGLFIGLAFICKQEYAFAALASAIALILTASEGSKIRTASLTLLPALVIPGIVYGFLLLKVSYSSLFKDTFFLPAYIPSELIYFNKERTGMANLPKAIGGNLQVVALLAALGGIVGFISICIAHFTSAEHTKIPARWIRRLFIISAGALAFFFAIHHIEELDWLYSPTRALPILCGLVIFRYWLRPQVRVQSGSRAIFLLGVFSFVVLIRDMPRTPSGGPYAPSTFPLPIVLLTFLTLEFYPRLFSLIPRARQIAQWLATILFLVVFTSNVKHNIEDYKDKTVFDLQTRRGDLVLPIGVGLVFKETLTFIERNTKPGDYIFAAPEGSSLNFLSDRPAPLRYEVLTPGFLNDQREAEAIQQLKDRKVKFVFILNRATDEFGPIAFGRDYCSQLMNWIKDHYEIVRVFGVRVDANSEIGTRRFFIKCYELKPEFMH